MDFYKLLVRKSAEKELRAVPRALLVRLAEKIEALSRNPRPQGVQMLKGESRYYRLRQGDYRVIYEVNDAAGEVTIIKVGHRREVYD